MVQLQEQERKLQELKSLFPRGQVFTDQTSLISYEVDAGLDKGRPDGVVFPCSVEDVVRVVRWASHYHVPLIARGAGTGLSGGAVAEQGGVIVDFARMNQIVEFDVSGKSAVVQPALINLRLDDRARTEGLYFPPDPSSQRASTIGGNVSENSGGPHCFKYGVTTNYITGLNVVLMDGSRARLGGRAFDYPEYDLCGLVTGSEGMLSIITDVTVRLLRNPPAVKTLLAVFDTVERAGEAVSAIISTGLTPATMEMMDQQIARIVEPYAHANLPLDAGAVLIIEFDGYAQSLDSQVAEVMNILSAFGGYGMRIARNEEERFKIWLARKSAAGAIAREAPAQYTVDVTVPRSRLAEALAEVNEICKKYQIRVGHVFHAGDGNLHPLILVTEPDNAELMHRIHEAGREMVQCCVEKGGSLTGEHGVGIEKRQFMPLMHNAEELLAMWDVKQAFDPDCLLNPHKVFPQPEKPEDGPFLGYTCAYALQANETMVKALSEHCLLPQTAAEAAQQLRTLSTLQQQVRITDREQVSTDGLPFISAAALRGVVNYAPDDLYITVGAGTPLQEVQEFLARHKKQVALASPWTDTTVGALVAANENAPLRTRYGAIRDNVLCATVALADGRVIRTGRPIMKNVAGYDLTKAFVGSRGTLGLLIDVSLKVVAQPRARRTLLVPVEQVEQGLRYGTRLLNLTLNASAVLLCKGVSDPTFPESAYVLVYTAEGIPEDVEAELEQVSALLREEQAPEPIESSEITGTSLWAMLLRQTTPDEMIVRAGVPVKDITAYGTSFMPAEDNCVIDLGSGFLYTWRECATVDAATSWLESLRQPALGLGGYAVVVRVPERLATTIDRWGYQPDGLQIMKRLKTQWDPRGILNPGVFLI